MINASRSNIFMDIIDDPTIRGKLCKNTHWANMQPKHNIIVWCIIFWYRSDLTLARFLIHG